MGPHGLLIGATGSGKSELLRTLVLGLAATHSSEQLNFVLVDFKGGATFASLRPAAAHRRGDHQPGRRAAAGRPDGGRHQRRADPPPGAAAPGRQLRQPARLRAGPGGRRAARPAAVAAADLRRVLRAALGQARLHRPVRADRPAGPVARRAPAAGQPAAGGGAAARAGHPPVVPDRAAHLLGAGVPDGARGAGRARAAPLPRARLPARSAPSRWSGSRPRTSPARSAGGAAATGGAGGRRGPAARLLHPRRAGAGAGRPGRPVPAVEEGTESLLDAAGRPAGRAGATGPPGVAAAAGASAPTLDELLGPVGVDPQRGLAFANPELHGAPPGAGGDRRQAVRAATRPAVAGAGRRRPGTSPWSARRRAASRTRCAR